MTSHAGATHPRGPRERRDAGTARRGLWAFAFFAILAAAYLVAEHRAHVAGLLPYLVILACPLMHLFMHRGHGGHGDHRRD